MFKITADEITYDGRRVALLRPDLNPTFLDDVLNALECATPGAISEEKHAQELKELSDEKDSDVADLERQIERLTAENEKWLGTLNSIGDCGTGDFIKDLHAELARTKDYAEKCRLHAIEADRKHTALLKKRGR